MRPAKAKTLANAVQDIEKSEVFRDEYLSNLWGSKDPSFDSCETNPFFRLKSNLERESQLRIPSVRLTHLFFLHDIERLEITIPETELRQGRGRRAIVLERVEQICGIKKEKAHSMLKRSKAYLTIAQIGGIGSLLRLGSKSSM